jgi:hypothetical protein
VIVVDVPIITEKPFLVPLVISCKVDLSSELFFSDEIGSDANK